MNNDALPRDEAAIASMTAAASTTWIGALSFEERCLGSLEQLASADGKVDRIIALDYSTSTVPEAEAEARREFHWKRIESLADRLHARECRRERVSAYSFADAQDAIIAATRVSPTDLLLLDVTCLTKIHAVAAGSCLSQLEATASWVVAYSSPRSFCDLVSMDRRFGWRDILIVPLVEGAALYHEASSRGVVLLGHEHDRLVVGLRELQPAGGTIVLPWERARPDLRYVMERNNRNVLKELAPRRGIGWETRQIEVADVAALQEIVEQEADAARSAEAPIILFPLGPKLMVFWAARVMAEVYPAGGWVVYPVPGGYDPDYSEGIETTIWMGRSWSQASLCPQTSVGSSR